MQVSNQVRDSFILLTAKRYRRILIASAATLFISVVLIGLITMIHWRGQQAMQHDTTAILQQTGDQLMRSLQSRRGTLTLLRDTLNRQSDLTLDQQRALGASAVEHTRHLLGTAIIRASQPPTWWVEPKSVSTAERAQLTRAIVTRTQTPGVWRVPSTFVVPAGKTRVLLVMLEPLRAPSYRQSAVLGVFDLHTFFEDFFSSTLPARYPVQLLSDETLLYRSSGWQATTKDPPPILEERRVNLDAARWTLQMQPGHTSVVQTLSWFNVLLVALSVVAGCGVTMLIWIFAARTWILQRAVTRRTAALRRVTTRLRHMAITDELTGLYNRRFFLNRWDWECERAKRYQRPLACLMIDVNGFKQVNDHLGHHAGDLVLKQVAQELTTMLRQSDILARFGGDEFVIALPETSHANAAAVAEKLRQLRIPIPEGDGRGVPPVSLSVGIGEIESNYAGAQEILEAADQSLYAHKRHHTEPMAR